MARYNWRLVFAIAEKMERAIQDGIFQVDSTVILWDYRAGISSAMKRGNPSEPTICKASKAEMDMAFKIVRFRIHNPVKAELPPMPSPEGGSSTPSGFNDEGFGPDGKIVTCGVVLSTDCPDVVGDEVEISPIGEEEE